MKEAKEGGVSSILSQLAVMVIFDHKVQTSSHAIGALQSDSPLGWRQWPKSPRFWKHQIVQQLYAAGAAMHRAMHKCIHLIGRELTASR